MKGQQGFGSLSPANSFQIQVLLEYLGFCQDVGRDDGRRSFTLTLVKPVQGSGMILFKGMQE